MLWVLFYVVIIFWAIFSVIFIYHWHRYGRQTALIITAETVYFIVSVALIVLTFTMLQLI